MPLINHTFSTLLHSLIYLKVLNYSFSFSFLIWLFQLCSSTFSNLLESVKLFIFPLHSLFIFSPSFLIHIPLFILLLVFTTHLLSLFIHYSFRMLNNYFMDVIITWLNKWEGIDKVRVRVVN